MADLIEVAREVVESAAGMHRSMHQAENAFDVISGEQLVMNSHLLVLATDVSRSADRFAEALNKWETANA